MTNENLKGDHLQASNYRIVAKPFCNSKSIVYIQNPDDNYCFL